MSKIESDHLVLVSIIIDLAQAFGTEELGHDVGEHMTCTEADLFAQVMATGLGEVEPAARFLAGHASEDDGGDSHPWVDEDPVGKGDWGPARDARDERVLELARKYVREVLIGE